MSFDSPKSNNPKPNKNPNVKTYGNAQPRHYSISPDTEYAPFSGYPYGEIEIKSVTLKSLLNMLTELQGEVTNVNTDEEVDRINDQINEIVSTISTELYGSDSSDDDSDGSNGALEGPAKNVSVHVDGKPMNIRSVDVEWNSRPIPSKTHIGPPSYAHEPQYTIEAIGSPTKRQTVAGRPSSGSKSNSGSSTD